MTDSLHDDVRSKLRDVDQLYTTGRQVIIDVLRRVGAPMTLPQILQDQPSLTQSSVYRNLAMMEEAGVVRRLVHNIDHAHYELAEDLTAHHHHLICRSCGKITDITLDHRIERALDSAFAKLAAEVGFTPDHHDIDVYGTCSSCT